MKSGMNEATEKTSEILLEGSRIFLWIVCDYWRSCHWRRCHNVAPFFIISSRITLSFSFPCLFKDLSCGPILVYVRRVFLVMQKPVIRVALQVSWLENYWLDSSERHELVQEKNNQKNSPLLFKCLVFEVLELAVLAT